MAKIYYQDLYHTKDSETAAILYSSKQILDSTYWENGSCFFVFQDKKRCEEIISDYLNDKITVGAKSLIEAIRTIRNLVKSGL